MSANVRSAVDGHVFVKVDDYLTISQARLLARQIMSAADEAEIVEAQQVDVKFTRTVVEQLAGDWFNCPNDEFMGPW